MTTTQSAIFHGLRQALAVPKLLLLLWLSNLFFAVPASLILGQILSESFAKSRVSSTMLEGFDFGWHAEFEAQASSLGQTFQPPISGPGPMLGNLEAWWSGELFTDHLGLVVLGLGYAVLWAFLLGGVLERLAFPSVAYSFERFSRAGGRCFLRFVGLAVISAAAYWAVYELARRAYGWIESTSRDVTEEGAILLWILPVAILTVGLLILVRMIFDYAKIAIATDSSTSVLQGLRVGLRFVYRFPIKTLGVALALAACSGLFLGLYAWLGPGAEQSTLSTIVLAFLGGQLYLLSRLALRVALLGSQLRLYQVS